MLLLPGISERKVAAQTVYPQHPSHRCALVCCHAALNKHKFCFKLAGQTAIIYENEALYCVHVFKWLKKSRGRCVNPQNDTRNVWTWTAQNLETYAKVGDLFGYCRPYNWRRKLYIIWETAGPVLHQDLETGRSVHGLFHTVSWMSRNLWKLLSDLSRHSQLQHYWRWVMCISECSWNKKSECRMENKIITMAKRVSLATDGDQNSVITFYEQGLNLCLMEKTLNSKFSAGVLRRLMRAILGMGPQYWEKGNWFLLHNNASTHLI